MRLYRKELDCQERMRLSGKELGCQESVRLLRMKKLDCYKTLVFIIGYLSAVEFAGFCRDICFKMEGNL